MEETKVGPALTAEEWARVLSGDFDDSHIELSGGGFEVDVHLISPCIGLGWHNNRSKHENVTGAHVWTSQTETHQIAAMALYGQPFGFDHDDVARLQTGAAAVYEWWLEGGDANKAAAKAAELQDLADRIAALLPPREQED